MARGRLRIYLGAAPGVGKTYAMLDEGHRRMSRGTDVVVGVVETHGRPRTIAQVGSLEVMPRRISEHRGVQLSEMDLDGLLARRPAVCLVDELAHTNAPGSRNERRFQDVEELLAAGIEVITTMNVQHLESLNDVVAAITGIEQNETVPDAFVRSADQIELVDMSPEALRRRLAHGNVYPAERIDTALANYFQVSNLSALRELALLWVADRVEDSLQHYLADHGIGGSFEVRERVVVALSGTGDGDALIRRAARMAGRTGGDLLGVRVVHGDGLADTEVTAAAAQRILLTELGGTYHEVVGDDVASSLVSFARTERATQLVLGSSSRTRWTHAWRGSVVAEVIRRAGTIDVHVIAGVRASHPPSKDHPALPLRRRLLAGASAAAGLPALTAATLPWRSELGPQTELLLFLCAVVAIAVVGGAGVAFIAAVAATFLVNYFFVPPYGTFDIAQRENVVALVAFVIVALTVGALVDRTARRAAEGQRARAEGEVLARAAAALVAEPQPMERLLDLLRTTFAQRSVALYERTEHGWVVVGTAGSGTPAPPGAGHVDHLLPSTSGVERAVTIDGPPLSAADHRLLRALLDELAMASESAELTERVRQADRLREVDAVRTALLHSVSHDLRTPIATIKAFVSGLRQPAIEWSPAERAEALAAIEDHADRLDAVVGNLLDASRLEAGALAVCWETVGVDELLAVASRGREVDLVVPDGLPPVRTDPALADRALANLIDNACKHQPPGHPVRIDAGHHDGIVVIRIVDRGPGLAADRRPEALQPFQRLDDRGPQGAGLGLAIASGFLNALGGRLDFDDTPGGGLTAQVTLPVAAEAPGGGDAPVGAAGSLR